MKHVLTFDDPLATRLEFSGGKGANLSLLTQQGFPVPSGFVLSAQAYREFIAPAADLIRSVEGFDFETPERLKAQSLELVAGLERLTVPESIAEEVLSRLRSFPKAQAFSVRSSSTMEDLSAAAFAGQHETYLNCVGEDEILAKIKACYLSLWADRAIAYRAKQRFEHWEAAMAVVVQSMVFCDVAGVAFSVNPVSGDLGEIVVDANYGLGESVVSGEAEVDHFEIDKETREVRRSSIATKRHRIVGSAQGTVVEDIPADQAEAPCLTDAQLKELAELLARIEESYRFPQDIEWGFKDGTLFLLQSRPITTIPPRWTRDESAERFPNVVTPLTWDMVEEGFHESLNYSFRLMGFPPYTGKWFTAFDHYIYGNQNAVMLYARRSPLAIGSIEELVEMLPRVRDEFRWVQELPVIWSRDLDAYLIRIGELMNEPLEDRDLKGVWAYVNDVNKLGSRYFLPNIAISITQTMLYRVLLELLKRFAGEEIAPTLLDRLTGFCETKTGIINRQLFELAQMIRAEPKLEKLVRGLTSQELIESGKLDKHPEFAEKFREFLQLHGHREIDFDAYHPTWVEAPWVVLDNLRLILDSPMEQTPEEKEGALRAAMHEAEFAILSRAPRELHFFLHELLRLTRTYTSLDDLEHYQTTRLALPARKGLKELGKRLYVRDVIAEPSDVYFARYNELDEAIREDDADLWARLAQNIRKEKEAYLRHRDTTPDWVLGEKTAIDDTGDLLTGIPGSSGEAEGTIFQVLGPEDFGRFPKGSILVTRTTNPAWTPLFYSAIALVTESGGPLSHGAVTAREMGIPAVMSVHGALGRLKTGMKVRVNGTAGKVELLEPAPVEV